MGRFVDLTGQRFGKLLVVKRAENYITPSGNSITMWECQCDCGNTKLVSTSSLKNNRTQSCGCLNKEDLTGNRFGKLTVVRKVESKTLKSGKKNNQWLCICDCGNETTAITAKLKNGHTKSCGCLLMEKVSEHKDLTGMRFGKLTVIKYIPLKERKTEGGAWKCRCDCGNIKELSTNSLTEGRVLSCGCYNKEVCGERAKIQQTTHGMSKTRIYNIWNMMKQRCDLPTNSSYKNYGGRGIGYCEEWEKFEPFFDWAMKNGYSDDLTIDRIDINGNYEPSNCRWITMREQMYNKRNTTFIEIGGKLYTTKDISEKYGIPHSVVERRNQKYKKGLCSLEELVSPYVKKARNNTGKGKEVEIQRKK